MADPKAPPTRKGPSVGLLLAGLLMVLLAVGVVLWQIPLTACPTCTNPAVPPPAVPGETAKTAACPSCKTVGVSVDRFREGTCPTCKAPVKAAEKAAEPVRSGPCVTCNGGGKVTFLKKWGYDRLKVDAVQDLLK